MQPRTTHLDWTGSSDKSRRFAMGVIRQEGFLGEVEDSIQKVSLPHEKPTFILSLFGMTFKMKFSSFL